MASTVLAVCVLYVHVYLGIHKDKYRSTNTVKWSLALVFENQKDFLPRLLIRKIDSLNHRSSLHAYEHEGTRASYFSINIPSINHRSPCTSVRRN